MRFLFVINDPSPTNLVHVRHTFREFLSEGILSAYREYPFKERMAHFRSIKKMEHELIGVVNEYQPDVLLWNQVAGTKLSNGFLTSLRLAVPQAVLIQETVDSFYSVPSDMVRVGRIFDMTLVNCGGLISEFRRLGCKNVILFPEKADHIQFGKPSTNDANKKYDVVMITNRYNPRNPFHRFKIPGRDPMYYMDGQKLRDQLVRLFSEKFGNRFAVFGYGWDGFKAAKGFLKFAEQEAVIQSAKIILGTNNWNNVNYYFSNRIVNSLISGIPHLCKRSKGLDYFFHDKEHCFYFDTAAEALEMAEFLLKQPTEYLSKIGGNGKNLVLAKHTGRIRYEYLIQLINAFKLNILSEVRPNFFLKMPEGYTVI